MKTQVNFKIDSVLKKRAQKLAKQSGVSLNAIVYASLRRFVETQELDIRPLTNITPKLKKALEKSRREYERGEYYGPFDNVKDAINFLDS